MRNPIFTENQKKRATHVAWRGDGRIRTADPFANDSLSPYGRAPTNRRNALTAELHHHTWSRRHELNMRPLLRCRSALPHRTYIRLLLSYAPTLLAEVMLSCLIASKFDPGQYQQPTHYPGKDQFLNEIHKPSVSVRRLSPDYLRREISR